MKKSKNAGFTMTELLIVLVIVGLLAALVGPALLQRVGPAKQEAARAQIANFASALEAYYIDTGRFPTTQQGLQALVERPDEVSGWNGPYLRKAVPNDPWGNPYRYREPGRIAPYEIVSYGADGQEGGTGEGRDINSWDGER